VGIAVFWVRNSPFITSELPPALNTPGVADTITDAGIVII
jgi:hypothetical protein